MIILVLVNFFDNYNIYIFLAPLVRLYKFEFKMEPILTIILPTYNEAGNVLPLLASINDAFDSNIEYEILFVDDSNDETPDIIKMQMSKNNKIRLMHRQPKDRTGLATAFIAGFNDARGKYICCMDSDLQHPPQKIPDLLESAIGHNADIVVATRYMGGGAVLKVLEV